jgi:hypothetical protein
MHRQNHIHQFAIRPNRTIVLWTRRRNFRAKKEGLMKLELMEDFYIEELKDILDAEKQLVKALPKMAEAATSPELRDAFQAHTRET